MNHNGKGPWAVVSVTCGDGRIRQLVLDYVKSAFGGVPDDVSKPGCVKKFLTDEAAREQMFEDMDTYLGLHGQPTILVLAHEDCGAYGGKQAFQSDEQEIEHHSRELERALPILEQRFPDKRVILGFMFLNGSAKLFQDLPVAS